MSDQLGDMPPATTQKPEHAPGGTDAIVGERYGTTHGPPTIPDADPSRNPAVEDVVPDEISALDDKQQEPDDNTASLDATKQQEGDPEPPA